MSSTLLTCAQVVTPEQILADGWVLVTDGVIAGVGEHSAPSDSADEIVDVSGGIVVPGLIDLHSHGGGGHDYGDSAEEIRAGLAFHRARGTTRSLVSLVTAPVEVLQRQLATVADLVEAGEPGIIGAHLEGPFLSRSRRGAQHPAHLLAADRQVLAGLLAAGRGTVRVVTIAPELPGALELIADVVAAGAVAAIGHTEADYTQALAGFAAGASLVTHLYNAMPPLLHRAPGPIAAAFDAGVSVEIINDGLHVDPAMVRVAARQAPSRLALVTDAISAAGIGDGLYSLGGQDVQVQAGQARLTGADRLAGSTLTMDAAVRRAVQEVGLELTEAVAAATSTPAQVLGLADRCGAIAVGYHADLVVLTPDLRVRQVLTGGRVVEPAAVA